MSEAKDSGELIGLLHNGYSDYLHLEEHEEFVERHLIYLSYADGYRSGSGIGGVFWSARFVSDFYENEKMRKKQEISCKAWNMLCQNLFKFAYEFRMITKHPDKTLLKKIGQFFSYLDNIPIMNYNDKYSHNDKIAIDFLIKLCKLGWSDEDFESYKPLFLRILIYINGLSILEEVGLSQITEEDMKIIEESLEDDFYDLSCRHRAFKTFLFLQHEIKQRRKRNK